MKKIIWSGFLVASALSTAYITPILADEVNNDITKNDVENIDTETQEKNCNMSDESTVDGKTQYVEKADNSGYEDDSNSSIPSTDQLTEGWQSDGRYFENGTYLVNQFKEINGSTYYFDQDGYRVENQLLYLNSGSYYFDESGIMQTGWQNVNGNNMYFNSDGTALTNSWKDGKYLDYDGIVVDNGQAGDYYLINGEIQKNQLIGYRYYGSDGKYLQNQWKKINDKWMFFSESGDYCRNGVCYANDNYYLFDEMGYMISTPGLYEFYGSKYYIQDNGVILTYAWKDDSYFSGIGAAITNQTWHVGDKCYIFDSESKLIKLSGWYTLNGNQYYLNGDGTVLTNVCKHDHYLGYYGNVVTNGEAGDYYLIDGKIQKDQFINSRYYGSDGKYLKNQWKYIDGHWMYFSYSGEYWKEGVYNINDKYYAFDNDGYMISIAGWYDFYGAKYYVQENGEVLTNSWKDDSYLTGSGSAIKDQTWYIGEKLYAFDSDAKLMKLSGWQVINGEKYYLNGDGTVLTNAWKDNYYLGYYGRVVTTGQAGDYYLIDGEIQKNQLIGSYYYGSDGKCIKKQWKCIDGYWMYFSEDGYYYSGYQDSNGEAHIHVYYINNKYYGFDENGHMVTGLQKSSGELYYFTSNGSALTNVWKDGRYFNYNGYAYRNCVSYVENDRKYYAFDENGNLIKTVGWKRINNTWYYLNGDGTVLSNCWKDGYYLTWDGSMGKNTWSNDGKYVGQDGKEVQPKWEKDENGWKLKYADGTYKTYGVGYVNGKAYVFDDNGYMISNRCEYTNIYVDGEYKYVRVFAAQDGHLIKGWNKEYDNWYYYGDNYGAIEKGLTTINNTQYYFEFSSLVCQRVFAYEGALYHSNANGEVSVINTKGQTRWMHFDNSKYSDNNVYSDYYYVENGVVVQNQFKIINGKKYYFYDNGIMAKGTFSVGDKYYLTKDSGSIVVNVKGWYQQKSDNVYSRYYFDNNSDLVVNRFLKLGNKTYYLSSDGRMLTGLFDVYGNYSDNVWTNKKYYADNNGVIYNKKGWFNIGLSKYYQSDDLYLLTNEWLNLDNNKYYFDYNGNLCVGVHKIYENGTPKVYYFDTNGILKKELDSFVGWKKFEGEWYYSDGVNYDFTGEVDGYFVTSGKRVTNGVYFTNDEKLYYLDCNGNKLYGFVSDRYGNKLYLDPTTGVGVTGWAKLNNQWYYYVNGRMSVGFVSINGKVNLFKGNGVWVRECKPSSWIFEDGKWYYLDSKGDVSFVYQSGMKAKINGVTYYFVIAYFNGPNSSVLGPYMASGEVWYDTDNQKCYWVNADGKSIDKTDGWKTTKDGHKAYVENGEVFRYGLKNINGKNYFFSMGYLVSGLINLDTKTYVFDDSYNEVAYKEGWNSLNGQWYYIKNGKALTNKWVGSYYLNYEGLTVTGLINGSNNNNPSQLFNRGQLVKNKWFKVDGNYYYTDDNGYVVCNKWIGDYYLDNNGVMVTNAWVDNYWCGSDGRYVKSAWVDNGNYYVNEKGLKVTNAWVEGYWCGSDGKYVKASWVDNNRYYVNEKGIYVAGTWKKDDIGWYYQAGDVRAQNITLNIKGTLYEFDSRGYWITK